MTTNDTTKANAIVNNSNGQTTLICGNCGAELVIPEKGGFSAGFVIGKDSNLGTIIAPVVGKGAHKGCGAPTIDLATLAKNPELIEFARSIVKTIEDNGYIELPEIERRWVEAQALRMIESDAGFHKRLQWKGYDYGWKVVINDLAKQAKLYAEGDMEGYADRNRWYNAAIVNSMVLDYEVELRQHIKEMKVHRHGRRRYVKLVGPFNGGKGLHLDEIDKVTFALDRLRANVWGSTNPDMLLKAASECYAYISSIRFRSPKLSSAFMNAYKAVGGYYTIKGLIKFEGLKMKVDDNGSSSYASRWNDCRKFIDTQASLEALEKQADKVVNAGVGEYGYMMVGLLKDFLKYNNFDYGTTAKKWKEQSDLRRAARAGKERRPRC